MRPESHHVYNRDKKGNYSNACCNLQGLLPVGDPYLVGESTWIYHEIVIYAPITQYSFEKDQDEFWALITKEQSQYPDSGRGIRPHGLINRCRNSQD